MKVDIECDNCGDVFEADDREYDEDQCFIVGYNFAPCPICGNDVEFKIDIDADNVIDALNYDIERKNEILNLIYDKIVLRSELYTDNVELLSDIKVIIENLIKPNEDSDE